MVKQGAKNEAFAVVFGKGASTFWFVMDNGFRDNGDEGSGVIVVWDVHVGVGGIFGV